MGNQLAVGGSLQELHLQDLGEGLAQDRILGGGRLLKSVQCWTEDGLPVVVKVYLKKEDDPPLALAPHHATLDSISKKLSLQKQPNVLFYHRIAETDKAGYLMRQYFYSNLLDRISTRPFFTPLGKKWIAYQILQGLAQMHAVGVYHGDLKCENVVLTGWDWVFLTDLSPFKPASLPADDPRDFSYYFDNRTCLLAPERFTDSNKKSENEGENKNGTQVTEAMDIFSAGCVIAQLFLDGVALFDLSQLLAYRKGETEHLNSQLSKIEDKHVRSMLSHMLQRDPSARLSAKKYIEKFTDSVFPQYFGIIHEHVMSRMVHKDCDQRVQSICTIYDTILEVMKKNGNVSTDVIKKLYEGELMKPLFLEEGKSPEPKQEQQATQQKTDSDKKEEEKKSDLLSSSEKELSGMAKLSELLKDTQKFLEQAGIDLKPQIQQTQNQDVAHDSLYPMRVQNQEANQQKKDAPIKQKVQEVKKKEEKPKQPDQKSNQQLKTNGEKKQKKLKVIERLPIQRSNEKTGIEDSSSDPVSEGMEIICALLCSNVRNARSISVRVQGLCCLQKLADTSTNYNRFQRLIPYTCVMLSDPSPLVKITAIKTLTHVLEKVTSFPVSETNLFNDYILPALRTLASDSSEVVRVIFAEYLPLLAYQARRFLEMGQLTKQTTLHKSTADDESILLKGTYDNDLNVLQDEFANSIVLYLSTDTSTAVKRALLKNITLLCLFYGRKKTNDFVLPMVITFLNSKEWLLRHAFFEQIVGISTFVGPTSLAEFILPCIVQALYDVEEFVIEQALNGLVSLCELGMFDKHTMVQMGNLIAPLLHHPNTWIRYDAIAYFAAMSKRLGLTDSACFQLKTLRPHLDYDILSISEYSLLEAVKQPISRYIFDKALKCLSEQDQSKEDNLKQGNIKAWEEKLGLKISSQEMEILDLMRPYLDQVARHIKSKSVDTSTETENEYDIIKLDKNVQTRYIPILQTPFTAPYQRKGVNTQPKQFNKDWNTMFNKPTASKLVQRRSSFGNGKSSSTTSTTVYPVLSPKVFERFKPKGILIAQSHEHSGSINELAVHESKQWFVSGGSDGTVKLWDSRLLEREFAIISKMTYMLSNSAGRIMSVCILNKPTTLVTASTDRGWVHIFDADSGATLHTVLVSDTGAEFASGFSDLSSVKKSSVNVVRPLKQNQNNLVTCGTQNGVLVGLDPRLGKQAFIWRSKDAIQQGPITAICGDELWMVTGTRRGFLTLWDLRFKMPVFTWRVGNCSIHRLGVLEKGNAPTLYVADDTREITLWNLENQKQTSVYKTYEKQNTSLIQETKTQIPLRKPQDSDPFAINELDKISYGHENRALEVAPDGNFFSAGTDRRIRYWDVSSPLQSYIVSGRLQFEKETYTSMVDNSGIKVVEEHITKDEHNEIRKGAFSQPLATHHKDTITDVKLIAAQYPMLLSCCRDGVIKLFK